LTTAGLGRPDPELLLAQHAAYVEALRALGLAVDVLPDAPGFPDAYFVEDAAVVADNIAVMTRSGAPSRRGEGAAIESVLARHRAIERIEPPGTLDGGDVLCAGGRWFIGLSERTNAAGAAQLGGILRGCGYNWMAVPVGAGLHLKSGVNTLGGTFLAVAAGFAGRDVFRTYDLLVLDPGDEYAANVLWVNGTLLMPAGFPRARKKYERLGRPIRELEMSEIRRMDGGLTCLSLRF